MDCKEGLECMMESYTWEMNYKLGQGVGWSLVLRRWVVIRAWLCDGLGVYDGLGDEVEV